MLKNQTISLLAGLLLALSLIGFNPTVAAEELKVGQTYHGFKLITQREVPEISSLVSIFEHQKSGARLMKLATADDNKVFCISFKTAPMVDSGVPHILEHSVLNGSKKFPVKSPFQILAKGSLNTFLNAMTGSDVTLYPVASRNQKDFFNLMDVYLDAVLFPRIYDEPKILKQEGWHYELQKEDGPLTYNGIVYNEMKGAFSSPTRVLGHLVSSTLYPDNTYGHSSGGLPESIPELTSKGFLAFHKKFYHPSNSYITLYGDGDTLAELKFINENYLNQFKRSKDLPTIAMQKAFEAPKEVIGQYPIGKDEKVEDKTYLALAFVAGKAVDQNEVMALQTLMTVLVDLPDGPVRLALQKAGIGKDVYSSYDDLKQGELSIVVKNANKADKDKFRQVVMDTLKKVAAEGLNKRSIEGVLNRTEFKLREADYGRFPKGLVYTFFALRPWMFAQDPFLGLEYSKMLKATRGALSSRYLEERIENYLLNNPHSALVVAEPKPGLEEEIAAKTAKKLADIKASWSKKKIAQVIADTKALKEYQKKPDSEEDVKKIPLLALSDIPPEADKIPVLKKKLAGVDVLHMPQPTNGIIYLDLMFDASVVPQELIPLLPTLNWVLGELDTKSFKYGELNTELNIHTGGLSMAVQTFPEFGNKDNYQPKLTVAAKVTLDKLDKLISLTSEILNQTSYDDAKRLAQVFGEFNSSKQSMARGAGHALAGQRLASYVSNYGQYTELLQGLSQVKFAAQVNKGLKKNSGDLQADLQLLTELLFNKQGLIVGITCSEQDYKAVEQKLPQLLNKLGGKKFKPQKYDFAKRQPNEGMLAPSKVQYVNKGGDYQALGNAYSGKLEVLSRILSRDYLTDKIRVQGGAYGTWAVFSRSGVGYFGSYRDPKLGETLGVYDQAVEYLKNFKASDREMTRFIIGTIARKDSPLTPAGKGDAGIARTLLKVDDQQRQKERQEILSTSAEDIRGFAKMVGELMTKGNICVYGNEKLLQDNKALFGSLIKVFE